METASAYSFADLADLAAPAEAVAVARVRRLAPVPESATRYYAEADVRTLVRGRAAIAPRVGFLIDLPDGKPGVRALRGKTVILFGRPAGQAGFQLLSSTAVLPWTAETEARVRAIVAQVLAPDAPPAVARVVEAFHVAGTVTGEGETQIFLRTVTDRPVSLSIIRRPGEEPRFGAALGEIVDEAAAIPAPDTLLWYRLACGLPAAPPPDAMAKLTPDDAQAATMDYRAFLDRLGPCRRTRPASIRPRD